MKILIIALTTYFSFSTCAEYRADIVYNDGSASQRIEASTEQEVKNKIKEWAKKSKALKGVWNTDPVNAISEKQVAVSFDENGENPVYETQYLHPSNATITYTDITSEIQEKQLEDLMSNKVDCGMKTIKFIAKNNVKKNLSKGQIKQMAKTYADIFDLLQAGAVDTAKDEITAQNPDGTIVTNEDKTAIISFIEGC